MMNIRRNITIIASVFCFLGAGFSASFAQNSISNVKTDTVYDGIMLAQLQRLFSDSKLNGENFVVVQRSTANGAPYLAVTTQSLPFTFFLGAVHENYSGDGDGVYAGFTIFLEVNLPGVPQSAMNDFNMNNRFVKLSPGVNEKAIYSLDHIMAGGATEASVIISLIPFFGGLDSLIELRNSKMVDYEPDRPDLAAFTLVNESDIRGKFDETLSMKILSALSEDMGDERAIHSFVEGLGSK